MGTFNHFSLKAYELQKKSRFVKTFLIYTLLILCLQPDDHMWAEVHSSFLFLTPCLVCIYFDTSSTFQNGLPEVSTAAAWLQTHHLFWHEGKKIFKALFDHISPKHNPSFPLAKACCKLCVKLSAILSHRNWYKVGLNTQRLCNCRGCVCVLSLFNLGDPSAQTLTPKVAWQLIKVSNKKHVCWSWKTFFYKPGEPCDPEQHPHNQPSTATCSDWVGLQLILALWLMYFQQSFLKRPLARFNVQALQVGRTNNVFQKWSMSIGMFEMWKVWKSMVMPCNSCIFHNQEECCLFHHKSTLGPGRTRSIMNVSRPLLTEQFLCSLIRAHLTRPRLPMFRQLLCLFEGDFCLWMVLLFSWPCGLADDLAEVQTVKRTSVFVNFERSRAWCLHKSPLLKLSKLSGRLEERQKLRRTL